MITADQILAHLVGDYILQSHWMATRKTSSSRAALSHVIWYVQPFLFFRPSWRALAVIFVTHFLIDRYRLARYVVWFKNLVLAWRDSEAVRLNARSPITATGFSAEVPAWLAVWLLIIVDNTMHIVINGLALRYL